MCIVSNSTKVKVQLLTSLEVIEKENIKKISGTPTNIKELINELRANIEQDNAWSTFYLIQIFAERIVDFMILKENNLLKQNSDDFKTMEKKVKKNRLTLGPKIKYLEGLNNYCDSKSEDFEILIKILELLNFIRNRFMFHVTNYDEYSFIYSPDERYKKEKHLIKDFKELKRRIDNVLSEFHKETIEWWLLERYSASLAHSIKSYERLIETQKKSIEIYRQYTEDKRDSYGRKERRGKRSVDNTGIYEQLPRMLSRISFIFILFFGKNDLNLFE